MGIGKKITWLLLILLVGGGGSFWLLRDQVLEGVVEKRLVSDHPMSMGDGWYLSGVAWEGIGWEGIVESMLSRGFFDLYKLAEDGSEESRIQFFVGETRIYPATSAGGVVWNVEGRNVKIRVSGSTAFLPGNDLPDAHYIWEEIWLELDHFVLNTGRPEWSRDALNPMVRLMSIWKRLEKEGTLWAGQQMEGKVWIRFPDKVLFFNLISEHRDRVTYLATRPRDLQVASQQLKQRLTEAELELLARYPLRLPVLFAIKEYSSRIARIAVQRNHGLSEPAYRHLLWSYLLTREYGAEFAERVTTAHEIGETGNTPQKSAMDLQNNALGRQLYLDGVKLRELLEIAKKDPRVQRP